MNMNDFDNLQNNQTVETERRPVERRAVTRSADYSARARSAAQTHTASASSTRTAATARTASSSRTASSYNTDRPRSASTRTVSSSTARTAVRRQPQPKQTPIGKIALTDFAIFCVCILLFALFHHVIPRKGMGVQSGEQLPGTVVTAEPQVTEPSEDTDPMDSEPVETDAPAETQAPELNASGMWGAKFADKFITGEPVYTEDSYTSENIALKIDKIQDNGVTYFVADIYLRDLQYFKTAFAEDTFGRSHAATVTTANEHNAVLAISGDYCGMRNEGLVIRNGQLYRQSSDFMDVMVMYNDGSMVTYAPGQYDLEAIKANGAWQAWDFGPMLLKNGEVMTEFNSNLRPKNPRSAIGYYEPGHYCLVTVDGRQDGYSSGMSLAEMSQMFHDLGCTAAYNLDGGQSAVMAFHGEVYSQPYGGGRSISDIVYIGE